jgi:hypothetical protein
MQAIKKNKKQSKNLKGSLTVEAALILPWFLFAVMSIIYLVKVTYIHNHIQYAITESANNMAVHAYLLESAHIIDTQQEVYSNFLDESVIHKHNTISDINKIENVIKGLTSYNISINNKRELGDLKFSASSAAENIEKIKKFKNNVVNCLDSTYKSINTIFEGLIILVEDTNYLATTYKKVGMEYANSLIGEKIIKTYMKSYISKSQYNNWNIVNGANGMDYSHSEFMLKDDNIRIVVKYKVRIPFPLPKNLEIPIVQSIKVRAWVGNNNYLVNKNNGTENNKTNIVYITPTGVKYHKSTCTCVNLKIEDFLYKDVKNKRKICKICSKNKVNLSDNSIVYGTKTGDKYHIYKDCPGIKRNAKPIEKEKAIRMNYKPCGICYKEDLK